MDRDGSTAETLATFVGELTYSDLPSEAPPIVQQCVLDTVGVTIAGLDEGAGRVTCEVDRRLSAQPSGVPIPGTDHRTSPTNAGLILGTAAHGLDYDDVGPSMTGHPSATLVPPLLAVASDVDSVTGREAITAFVAGYEVECYLDSALTPAHVQNGWHPTAILGPFGAATVAAVLLDLDVTAIRNALNICVSLSSGSSANVGSMTKPLHAGHAVRSGITAAYLADGGFTASEEAFDHEEGFFELFSGSDAVGEATHRLGDTWGIIEDGGIFKKYPSCYYTHAGIELMEELKAEHDLTADSIDRIEAVVSEGAKLENPAPATGLEAKFSNHYTIACALLYDSIGLDLFRDEALPNERTREVGERITVSVDPDLEYTSFTTELRVTTTDGAELRRRKETPPGYPGNRVSRDELHDKFSDCVQTRLRRDQAEALLETIEGLDEMDDIGRILTVS
ncbi:MmgE/PrpD family protein [Halobellus sp. GM3]|uniref:MmgE/PrpD family protein n=1 Tax=Halobellus sp. GM3 TaxID=3458410 RepID=UPI00403E115E